MNVLTGIYVPTAGAIDFDGAIALSGATSSEIALSGIARTFQNVQLFGEMTALENVHGRPAPHLREQSVRRRRCTRRATGARNRRARDARAQPAASSSAWTTLADEEARNLPYGKQRLLEIARALALDPQLLLLDEPAAGLTAPDIKELIAIIRKIREHGITRDPDRAPHGRGDERCATRSRCWISARRSPRAGRPRCRPTRKRDRGLSRRPGSRARSRT